MTATDVQRHIQRCAWTDCPLTFTLLVGHPDPDVFETEKAFLEGWRCPRHEHPDEVLTDQQPARTMVATVNVDDAGHHVWATPTSPGRPEVLHAPHALPGHGDSHGHTWVGLGWRAFADDWPPGTRLVINARVEPPT